MFSTPFFIDFKRFSRTKISEFSPSIVLLVIDEYVGGILGEFWAIFEELSIPCKLVLNVVGMEKTNTLVVLKYVVCVSRFDSSSIFNFLKDVLILSISKEYLKVSVSIKRVSLFGLWSKALVLTTEYIALKWS
ncbi:hypothetical protein Gotur_020881 [Gossypium turneri]